MPPIRTGLYSLRGYSVMVSSRRWVSASSHHCTSRRRVVDETTLAGAQHKVSLSGPSLGHLISELSATRPGMEALRKPGQTISEEHRTMARQMAGWIIGLPAILGASIVGWKYLSHRNEPKDA